MKTNDILNWMGPTVDDDDDDDDSKSFEQNLYMKLDVRRRASTITTKKSSERKESNETKQNGKRKTKFECNI